MTASASAPSRPSDGSAADGVPTLCLDATHRLARDGYAFGLRGYRDVGADAFRTRLVGRPVVVARGSEAAHVFGAGGFRRSGAIPRSAMHLLQDEGSVQALEGERHRVRRALLLEIAERGRGTLVALFRSEWGAAVEEVSGERTSLLDVATTALARAAFHWVGVMPPPVEERAITAGLRGMIDSAASIGPRNWAARAHRRRVERWAASLVSSARSRGDAVSIVGRLAHHEEDGRPLDVEVAAVELLNLLRPVVAVARFVAFAGHALHAHPEWAARVGTGDAETTRWMADEVRRFYPFFPMIGGIATAPFRLRGEDFPAGQCLLLDLYGTDHSPELWERPDVFDPFRFADASPHAIVAQGVGDGLGAHRCPGELATSDLVAEALSLLVNSSRYEVLPQDLRISLRRIPARPEGGMAVVFA